MAGDKRERILVIEDEEQLARFLQSLFESSGYQVHVEPNGTAALKYLAGEQVALVVLDLRLPDMSGYDVCRYLRQSFHSWALPVIMLTGMDRPIDQLRGFAYGADAYLTKPCDPFEILKTAALLLGEASLHRDTQGAG